MTLQADSPEDIFEMTFPKISDFLLTKISQKICPKIDAFLGILLNPNCVTFWSDSVRSKLAPKLPQDFKK